MNKTWQQVFVVTLLLIEVFMKYVPDLTNIFSFLITSHLQHDTSIIDFPRLQWDVACIHERQ